jgi:hypothetical protein
MLDNRWGELVQHFFDIEYLHNLAVDLCDPGDKGFATGARWWRTHIAGGALHDALDALYMQALTRATEFGNDQATFIVGNGALLANGLSQINHRQRRTA